MPGAGCFTQESTSAAILSEQGQAFLRLKLHHVSFSEAGIPSSNPNSTLSRLFEGLHFLNYTMVGCTKVPQRTLPVLSRETAACECGRPVFRLAEPPTLNVRIEATLKFCCKLRLCSL